MNQQKCACLQARDGRALGLLDVSLSGELHGLVFEARVEQRFCNPTERGIEIVYTFPLPWGAILLGADVRLEDQLLTGVVVERKQAEAGYESALSEGDTAIMLEKNQDQSYSLNLGNLAAGEHCVITLRYAQTLQFEQRGLRLLIPTVIAPRYGDPINEGGLAPHQVSTHDLLAEYPFMLDIRLHGDLTKARVSSPSHAINVRLDDMESGSVLAVSLTNQAMPDRDFVLVVDQLEHDSIVVAAPDLIEPEAAATLLSFCPRVPAHDTGKTALNILVDCSGSMAGDSINAAKQALNSILQQLDEGDQFSLSQFGSTVEHRSRGLWNASESTKLAAQRWVASLAANRNGTEIGAALLSTFALASSAGSDVLLITDGEINAIDRTIEIARASGHRLFVVGIGSSPAESHLRRLAEATGGCCDFVAPGEAVTPAVLRTFTRLRSPRLTNLALDWPEGAVPCWASPLPLAIFDGDTVYLYALLPKAATGEVHLLGKPPGETAARIIGTARLQPTVAISNTLPRLVAGARLRSVDIANPADAAKATELAVQYQLVSDRTHFLLVHERAECDKAVDMPLLHAVDQMVPAGWSGTGSVASGNALLYLETRVSEYKPKDLLDWHDGPGELVLMDPLPPYRYGDNDPDTIYGQPIDISNPRYWTHSRANALGLTPLGLSEWLRIKPQNCWPTSYVALGAIGMEVWVVDWLELAMARYKGAALAEESVIAAFLYLMSRRDTRHALNNDEDVCCAFSIIIGRLRELFAYDDAVGRPYVTLPLVEAMTVALQGMSAEAWPPQVFEMRVMAAKVVDV